jgi:hypothetical protein
MVGYRRGRMEKALPIHFFERIILRIGHRPLLLALCFRSRRNPALATRTTGMPAPHMGVHGFAGDFEPPVAAQSLKPMGRVMLPMFA